MSEGKRESIREENNNARQEHAGFKGHQGPKSPARREFEREIKQFSPPEAQIH